MRIGGKKPISLSLFTDDIIIYILKNQQKYQKKFLNLISDFRKIAGNHINMKISIVFPYTRNKQC